MNKMDRQLVFSLLVLITALFLIAPVGLTMAMDQKNEVNNETKTLPPVDETIELDFEPIEIISMRTAVSAAFR